MVSTTDDLKDRFYFTTLLSSAQVNEVAEARELFHGLVDWIAANVPNSRERAVALTELESAAMWLNKAISRS